MDGIRHTGAEMLPHKEHGVWDPDDGHLFADRRERYGWYHILTKLGRESIKLDTPERESDRITIMEPSFPGSTLRSSTLPFIIS
jgi:hypothetical protein